MQPGADYDERTAARDAQREPDAATRPPARPVRRSRIGLLLLLAFSIQVIAIAAAGNQAVIDAVEKSQGNPATIKGGFHRSLEVFGWRFSPRAHDLFHVWAGGLALIGTTIVLSLLLIALLVRGPFTFARAFFGTWLAVVGATMIGGYVRALVIDTPSYSTHGIPARALFSPLAPNSTTFVAGLALGLVVALVVGFVGLATRRPPEVAVVSAPRDEDHYLDDRFGSDDDRDRPEQYGDNRYRDDYIAEPPREDTSRGYGTADNPTTRVPWYGADRGPATSGAGAADSADTTALPAMRPRETADEPTAAATTAGAGAHDADTTALPRPAERPAEQSGDATAVHDVDPPGVDSPGRPAHDGPVRESEPMGDAAQQRQQTRTPERAGQTAQFPRPPDDEDLDPEHH